MFIFLVSLDFVNNSQTIGRPCQIFNKGFQVLYTYQKHLF